MKRNHITIVNERCGSARQTAYWIEEGENDWEPHDRSDYQAVRDGVSVTPLQPDLTDYSALEKLETFAWKARHAIRPPDVDWGRTMADRNVRRLAVEPTAGLLSRLRVIDSAIALSRDLGSALRIVWTRTPDSPCRFDELFAPLRGVQIAERSQTRARIVRHIGSVFKYDRILTEATVERLIARHDFTELRGARYPYLITAAVSLPDARAISRA